MVLYRSPELFISDRLFVVRRGRKARYPVAELKNIHVVCEEIRRGGQAVGRYVGAFAMVLIIVAVLLDSPLALALALLALGGAAAIGSLSTRRHRRVRQQRRTSVRTGEAGDGASNRGERTAMRAGLPVARSLPGIALSAISQTEV